MNPELKIPEFENRNYATTADYPDEFGDVKVIDPVEAQQARRQIPIERTLEPFDDGARLDTPAARRQRTITDMTADLERAIERAEKAKAWAQSIGISSTIVSKLNRGLDALQDALGEISQFESRT